VRGDACGRGSSPETGEMVAQRRSVRPAVVGMMASWAGLPARLADVAEASSAVLGSGGL
jgi:hypothetical protein